MIAQPHWFAGGASLGMLHWPSVGVRGGVVVCPPLGYEGVCAYRSLRLLAERLAAIGIACLRVSYPGMGFGPPDEAGTDQLPVWRSTIAGAAGELRSMGLPWVGAVGLRFSATLAANAPPGSFDAVVAWDPVVNGRRYTRGLRMLGSHTATDPSSDSLVVAGVEHAAATVASMATVTFAPPASVPSLVLQRAEPSGEPSLAEQGVPTETVDGTAAMLDVDAELSSVPGAVLDRIVRWVDEHAPAATTPRGVPAVVADARHQHVDIAVERTATRIGSAHLFALLTRRPGTTPTHAVLFLDNGASPAFGPGGAWVDWATEVARRGGLAVQMDFSGFGESPARGGEPEHDAYSHTAGRDVAEVVAHLRANGVVHVTTVGLCSGALLAFDAAMERGCVDHVVAINARFDKPFTDGRHRRYRSGGQTNRVLAAPLSKAPLFPTFERVPSWVWHALARTHLVASPAVALQRALAAGARVTLVFGPHEWGLRALERRDPRAWSAVQRHPRCSVTIIDELDHSMFEAAGRAAVEAAVCPSAWPARPAANPSQPPTGATS